MSDYEEKSWVAGDTFEPEDATAMSAELEEQEVKDTEQDADIASLEADNATQATDISDLQNTNTSQDADITAAQDAADAAQAAADAAASVNTTQGTAITANASAIAANLDLIKQALAWPSEKLLAGFCYPHRLLGYTDIPLVSGRIHLDYFTAPETATRNTILKYAGSVPNSGATPTMIKFGVYSVAGNGDLTKLAETANDTSLFSVASSSAAKALSSGVNFVLGNRFAVATLVITTGTINNMLGSLGLNFSSQLTTPPKLCGQVAGQTDLPSFIASGSVDSTFGGMTWSRFS